MIPVTLDRGVLAWGAATRPEPTGIGLADSHPLARFEPTPAGRAVVRQARSTQPAHRDEWPVDEPFYGEGRAA